MAGSSHNQPDDKAWEKLAWPADESGPQTGAARKSLRRSPMTPRVKKPEQIIPKDVSRVVARYKKGVNHQHLQYIKGAEMIEMRPALTEDTDVLFVLTSRESVSHCVRVGTSFVITNYDDNKARFDFQDRTTFPIAVSTPECDIGDIDDDSENNYDIAIDYYNNFATNTDNEEDVLAWYQIQYQDENIGEILIRPGLITFTFDTEAEVEHKALSIAYGINRALCVHLVESVQKRQPREKYEEAFLSLYENVFPLMEYAILRAAGECMDGDKYHLFLMDYRNQNKIVMIAKSDPNTNTYTALDLNGNQLFQIFEVAKPKRVMDVNQHNICIGTCQESGVGNTKVQLRLANGKMLTCDSLTSCDTECCVEDSRKNVISKITNVETIDPRRSTVKIIFSKSLETNAKKLILSYIIKVAFNAIGLRKGPVPKIRLSKPVPFPISASQESDVPKRTPPSFVKGPYPRLFTFRAAGYSIISGTLYYDVISDEDKVYATMECQPPSQTNEHGMLTAKTDDGGTVFLVPDFLRANGMTMYSVAGHLLGYQSIDKFFTCHDKDIMVVAEEKGKTNLHQSFHNFKKGHRLLGFISETEHGLTLTAYSIRSSHQYLMFAYTAKLCEQRKFEKLQLPQIDYKYIGQKSNPTEY